MPVFLKPKDYLPHKSPMLLIDEVVNIHETGALVRSYVSDKGVLAPFLNEDGSLDGFYALELFSQAVGIWSGYQTLLRHESIPPLGMILSARDIKVKDNTFKAHDCLYILVRKILCDEKIVCFDGRIFNFKVTLDKDFTGLDYYSCGRVNLTAVSEKDMTQIFGRSKD